MTVSRALSVTLDYNFDKGNELYSAGDYAGAAGEYEKVISAGYESAELYYNLGNAYFREGQLGLAIANYIRAQRLDPGDEDIAANLEFARQFTIDKIEVSEETIVLDYIDRFFNSFTLNGIAWITAVLYVLTMTIILLRFVYRRFHIATPVFVLILSLFTVGAVFTGVKLDRDVLTRQGVVVDQQADVKNGPGENFNTKFTAHAGLVFEIEQEEAGYYWVNFENRLKGWIPKSVAVEI
jgi:tetratricopeptide (TPR) repeat protein